MKNLHRPMFRKGGSANEGITSGLRQGYEKGKLAQVQDELRILDQLAPAPQPRGSTAVNDFLINFGLNMASASPTGNIFQTAATQAKEPFGRFQQQKMYEGAASDKAASEHRSTVASLLKGISDDDKNKLWEEAGVWFKKGATNPVTQKPFASQEEAFDSLIQKSLMSKESFKTDEALYNETVEMLFGQNLKDQSFKGNNLGARTLAEHEAKVIHKMYPEKLIDQLDKQTTYIDSVYVDVDERGNMKLNNIGQNVGYRPNKIYFNISDGSFYKLGADGLTFTVVDVADFQD